MAGRQVQNGVKAPYWVNDVVQVTEPDIVASNGLIHAVDQVNTPPWPRNAAEPDIDLMAAIAEAKLLMAEEGASAALGHMSLP